MVRFGGIVFTERKPGERPLIKSRRGAAGKAIIATARKLLNTIFYTLMKNWVFEDFPNFELKACN